MLLTTPTFIYGSDNMNLHTDDVIEGLTLVESNNNPNAVSHKGAIGIAQLMPHTAKEIAERHNVPFSYKSLTDPDYSKTLAKLHLEELKTKYNDWHTVLTAYNRGEFGMKRFKKLKNTTVSSYSKKVLNLASENKLAAINHAKVIYDDYNK